jgi:hypothetical protein
MKTHMFSISMGGFDILLSMKWIYTLGSITMDYQELYMIFTQDTHSYTLKGLQEVSLEIIISHRMGKLLKKGHHGVIFQFNSIKVTQQVS